jgi:hypothetical protein
MRLWPVALAVVLAGCIDSSRVNDTCTWSDTVSRRLDLGSREDREHLRQDAEIANDLMVRFGDAHVQHRPDLQRPFRDQCIAAMTDSIIARHGVTKADIQAAERERIWWADFLMVFLPMAVVGVFATNLAVKRICANFEPDDRGMALVSTALLTPVIAALLLGVANFWSFGVEGWRLGNGHVSNRAFLIPVVTHGWIAYFVALAVCAGAAAWSFTKTPLTGGPTFASSRRRFV